jgi:hypothetical protein
MPKTAVCIGCRREFKLQFVCMDPKHRARRELDDRQPQCWVCHPCGHHNLLRT